MGALRLVPSDGLRADNTSSYSILGEIFSTKSSSQTSYESPRRMRKQQQMFHESWDGAEHRPDPLQPFVATVEPVDTTPEARERNILVQKVLIIASQLFPDAACSKDLQVEHVGAGSYHDVIGFTVPFLKPITSGSYRGQDEGCFAIEQEQYVIRVPRADTTDHEAVHMRREIAILRGLQGQLDTTIPRVISFDLGKNNVLDAPYTLETRLKGRSLQELVSSGTTLHAQNVSSFKQVVKLVETLAEATAPYAGDIAEEYGDCIDRRLCSSRIPMRLSAFPFDASSLTEGTDRTPLAFMLKLVDLWIQYDTERWPNEETFTVWSQIKGVIRSLDKRGFLGEAFHLSHGDLASRNIMAEISDDSTIKITGVVDWDFACFAPIFCAFRPPMDMWSGAEDVAVKECTKELIKNFKETASAEYIRYAFSKEAKLGRKLWLTLLHGLVEDGRRSWAMNIVWELNRLYPEDKMCQLQCFL